MLCSYCILKFNHFKEFNRNKTSREIYARCEVIEKKTFTAQLVAGLNKRGDHGSAPRPPPPPPGSFPGVPGTRSRVSFPSLGPISHPAPLPHPRARVPPQEPRRRLGDSQSPGPDGSLFPSTFPCRSRGRSGFGRDRGRGLNAEPPPTHLP